MRNLRHQEDKIDKRNEHIVDSVTIYFLLYKNSGEYQCLLYFSKHFINSDVT